jgi:hypothetical protein
MWSKVFRAAEIWFSLFLCKDNVTTLKGKHEIGQKCFLIYDMIWDGEILISIESALCFHIPYPLLLDIVGWIEKVWIRIFHHSKILDPIFFQSLPSNIELSSEKTDTHATTFFIVGMISCMISCMDVIIIAPALNKCLDY